MRTKKSLYNIAFGLTNQIVLLILNFITRSIFIHTLGVVYLGINGLFTNILAMLSLANLGIGSSIVYSLYKPLAEKDEVKIKSLMCFYQTAYRSIGLVILVIGLCLLPFLGFFVQDAPDSISLEWIYLLFLVNSVSSYFFAYKRSIFTADQKGYILSNINTFFSVASLIIQSIILFVAKNFVMYLIFQITATLVQNIFVSQKANREYAVLKNKNRSILEKQEKINIFKNLFALSIHNISSIVLNSTDNIIISKFIGVITVGLYSNYTIILQGGKAIITQIFNSLIASIGNLSATESEAKKYEVFNALYFANFWIYTLASVAVFVLLNPFITLWLGTDYLLSDTLCALLAIDMFVGGLISSSSTFKDAAGLFWRGKSAPAICVVINIVLSVLLALVLDVEGVIIGTIISRLVTFSWVNPYVVFKHVFSKNLLEYFRKYMVYAMLVCLIGMSTHYINSVIPFSGFSSFVVSVLLCMFVPNIIIVPVFYKTREFTYLRIVAHSILRRKMQRMSH